MISTLLEDGKSIDLVWIPAHWGLGGEAEADRLARFSLSLPIGKSIYPFREDVREMVEGDGKMWERIDWPFSRETRTL